LGGVGVHYGLNGSQIDRRASALARRPCPFHSLINSGAETYDEIAKRRLGIPSKLDFYTNCERRRWNALSTWRATQERYGTALRVRVGE